MGMTDVLIVGGGLSGGLFARHLVREAPDVSVTVVESRALPPDPTSVSVGESTSEVGAWYLAERLGLDAHLQAAQIPKLGLRFFLARPAGAAFHERAETGIQTLGGGYCATPFQGTNPPTWQLHRGRLEREIHDQNAAAGVVHLDRRTVTRLTRGEPHAVELDGPNGPETVRARWVVDASARGLTSELLGPVEQVGHRIRASWAWVNGRIDPDRFSDDSVYGRRLPPDLRWRSTNHLVGPGRWVWLIPLSDGRTSVGIVSQPGQPSPTTPDDWIRWFDLHEPECAAQIRQLGVPSAVLQRDVAATRAATIVSPDRLARTGDAAGFLDPLYSSAIDHMALVNQLVVPVIADDRAGRPVERRCRMANALHARINGHYHQTYDGAYEVWRDPRVAAAKVAWDNAIYFAAVTPLVTSGRLADDDFLVRFGPLAQRAADLQQAMQAVFRAWSKRATGRPASGLVDVGRSEHLLRPLARLRDRLPQHDLRTALEASLAELEPLAVAMLRRAASDSGIELPAGPLNPYAATLDPSGFGALTRGRALTEVGPDLARSLTPTWLTP